ncbi:MAG: NfeD family protein [Terracidiphilus sp.]
MHWETFYFVCFLIGLFMSAFSLLGCMGHFGHLGHVHVPHAPHATHLPHGGAATHSSAGASHTAGQGAQGAGRGTPSVPWWNTFSLMIFLCWFGAAGYLLTRHGGFVAGAVLGLAGVCGVAGGAIIFFFLAKVIMPHEHELTADETDLVGVVGRVSATIRADGIGEIVYQQLGARYSAPARSEDGVEIQKQEEVFVDRYEKGIAYVRRWEDFSQYGN